MLKAISVGLFSLPLVACVSGQFYGVQTDAIFSQSLVTDFAGDGDEKQWLLDTAHFVQYVIVANFHQFFLDNVLAPAMKTLLEYSLLCKSSSILQVFACSFLNKQVRFKPPVVPHDDITKYLIQTVVLPTKKTLRHEFSLPLFSVGNSRTQ